MPDTVERTNDALDEFMQERRHPDRPRRRRKGKAQPRLKRDGQKRRAFRVLALLADLDRPNRTAVLKVAQELSDA